MALEMLSASAVQMSQYVLQPVIGQMFQFEFASLSEAGTLTVRIDEEIVAVIDAIDYLVGVVQTFSLEWTEDLVADVTTPKGFVDLVFEFDGPAGSSLILDEIQYGTLFNGDFQMVSEDGELAGWAVAASQGASVALVPAPESDLV